MSKIILKRNNQINNHKSVVLGGSMINDLPVHALGKRGSSVNETKPGVISSFKFNGPKTSNDSVKLERENISNIDELNENLKKINFKNMKKNNIKFIV
jgi:hypothetical protein